LEEENKIQDEPISKRPSLPNLSVPDERDLRFASTGSNFNPRNTQCIPPVKFFTFLDIEQISADFGLKRFATGSR
jgi:hypothetical protein